MYEWLKREGGEHYIYLSSREIVELCSQISSKDNTILVVKNNSDIINIIRDQENEYLQSVIINPEIEGKQIINFTKIYKS